MRRIKTNIIYLSLILTLLTAYVLPCHQINGWTKSFGYPMGWLTVYHDTIGSTIFGSTATDFGMFAIDTAIWYLLILSAYKAYVKLKNSRSIT